MNITLIIGSLDRGGSERQVVEFVRSLAATPHTGSVVCITRPGPLAPLLEEAGAKVVSLGLRKDPLPLAPFRGLRALLRLARHLRADRPDVVYAFLFWAYSIAIPMAAAVHPGALRVSARRSLPASDVPQPEFLRFLRWPANRLSHLLIANSEEVRAEWVKRRPGLSDRIVVVPNGTPLGREATPSSPGEPIQILCVANLRSYKGHADLIEALNLLDDELPPWMVTLVGEGAERSAIEKQVAALGLAGQVVLLGERDDVPQLLERADIVVLPSHTEGMPNALMEAMAHGVPVVATRVGGVPEVVGPDAGILAPPRDPHALSAALASMIRDPDLRRVSGAAGRNRARARFSVEVMRDRTLEALETAQRNRKVAIQER